LSVRGLKEEEKEGENQLQRLKSFDSDQEAPAPWVGQGSRQLGASLPVLTC